MCPLLAKGPDFGMELFLYKKESKKDLEGCTSPFILGNWMRRNHIVFDDMPFSLSMLKTSFVSILVSWARSIELEECSIIRFLFMHYIGFLMGGRFFPLFCIGQVPPCILWGFLAHSSFC